MKNKPSHTFLTKSHGLKELFKNVTTLSKFMKNLEKQSILHETKYPTNDYLGDGFEFFIELFLMLHPNDNRIGVYGYQPTQENDNGVDGIGTNIKNEKCVVQIKYRANIKTLLTATTDHLSNMFSDGMLEHGVVADIENKKNFRHFVFTTGEGLHFYTDNEMYKKKVKTFGFKEIKGIVDNNIPFWNNLREIINE